MCKANSRVARWGVGQAIWLQSPPATTCCVRPCCNWLSYRHNYTHWSYPFWPRVNSIAVPAKHCIFFLACWGASGSWNRPACSLGIRGQKHKRHLVAKNPRRSSWEWCRLKKRWQPRSSTTKIGAWKLDEFGGPGHPKGSKIGTAVAYIDGSFKGNLALTKSLHRLRYEV